MPYQCARCGFSLEFPPGTVIGRSEECPDCKSDIHCCIQCRFYDSAAYNECSEPQAERVVQKERANFCDYFVLSERASSGSHASTKDDAMRQLDQLFKK